jgi:NADH:ubiquinone oxidoreductase subunit K
MKRFLRPAIIILISLSLALTSAAATFIALQPNTGNHLSAAAFFLQTTPTPDQVDRSEVGSTDGIVVMGFVLAAIVLLPILLRRKAWSQLL